MRTHSRQVRMKAAEKLLKESKQFNIDEIARIFGYRFTSAFSDCFERTFGTRPKRYQMRHSETHARERENCIKSASLD